MRLKRTFQRYYDVVRPHLPRRRGTYRGYVARDDRLLDLTTARPAYKEGLVSAIEEYVQGKDVCIVGFGRGITSMIALEAGARSVTAYEAAEEMIEIGLESFALNGVPTDRLTVEHALVGEAVDVFGSGSGAAVVSPAEFDPKDVLVLDCEGAERSIVADLGTLPERLIVETHPGKGADAETLRELMEAKGLAVEVRPYEPTNDSKHVLVGTARSRAILDRIPLADSAPVTAARRLLSVR